MSVLFRVCKSVFGSQILTNPAEDLIVEMRGLRNICSWDLSPSDGVDLWTSEAGKEE